MKRADGKPHSLCCNADESEPGTFKDREIMRWTPHALVEGCAIAAYAIGAETVYIYIRGEFTEPLHRMTEAVREAYAAGLIGPAAMGGKARIDIHIHKGAGAYICGEETALMNSIEGRRGNPRIKPPFPAAAGVFGKPTTINNVETLAAVPQIITRGRGLVQGRCTCPTRRVTGTKAVLPCAGNVRRPGNYEVVLGFPFQEFLYDLCGGPPAGRSFKAIIPAARRVADPDDGRGAHDAQMDYEGFVAGGSMLGSGGVICIDDAQCMVKQILELATSASSRTSWLCPGSTQCREGAHPGRPRSSSGSRWGRERWRTSTRCSGSPTT